MNRIRVCLVALVSLTFAGTFLLHHSTASEHSALRTTTISGTHWVEIGSGEFVPSRIDERNGFPEHHRSGRAEQVAWVHDDELNRDVLWVGTSRGGLWKPKVDQNGRPTKYVPLTDNFPGSHTLGSFLVHPNDSRKILIGTGSFWGDGDGIYRTDNGGAKWSANVLAVEAKEKGHTIIKPVSPASILRMTFDRTAMNTVFAATSKGLLRSTDFGTPGTPWKTVLEGDCKDILQDPNHPNQWYAGVVGTGVMYSVDGGNKWSKLGSGIFGSIEVVSLAASKTDDHFLYALIVGTDNKFNGLYRFDDLPAITKPLCCSVRWKKIFADAPDDEDDPKSGIHTCSLACDPTDANHVLFGLKELQETHNATTPTPSWTQIDGGHGDYNDLYFIPNDAVHRLVTANDGGFYMLMPLSQSRAYTLDDSLNLLGINAFERSHGHRQGSLSVSESNPDEFAAGLQDNGVIHGDIHANPVITKIDGGDGGETSFLPKNHKVISFSSTAGGGGFRYLSTDGGTTFIKFGCNIGGEKNSTVLIDPTPDLDLPEVFTYKSDEAGTKSQVLSQDLSTTPCPWRSVGPSVAGAISHIDHTTNQQRHVIPLTLKNDFRVFAYRGPRTSSEPLRLKEITPEQLSCTDATKTCITSPGSHINADHSGLQPDTLYYTTGPGSPSRAFVSRDSGLHWTRVDEGMLDPSARFEKLIGNPKNPDEFFLATNRGVFHKPGANKPWERFDQGLRLNEEVSDIVINVHSPDGPRLYIFTLGRGFWMRTLESS